MKIFIPLFLLLSVAVVSWLYAGAAARKEIIKHARKVVPAVLLVAVILAVLFALMSVQSWRFF